MQARFAEEQFFFHVSQEARQQAYQWEMSEKAPYETRFRSAEYRLCQNTAQERLNMEAAVGQQYLVLRQELQEAEQKYTENIRQEARRFADRARAEVADSMQRSYNTIKLLRLKLSLSWQQRELTTVMLWKRPRVP